MVEKEESAQPFVFGVSSNRDASSAAVKATNAVELPPPKPTLGDAIALLEAKLAALGIVLQVPVVKSTEKMKVAGKLLSLPSLIHLAITLVLDTSDADGVTENSVGKASEDWKNSLVPGNVVALFTTNNKGFLGIENESVVFSVRQNEPCRNYGSTQRPQTMTELKLDNASHRFLVVDAGNGNIALFNPTARRFLGCKNGTLVASGFPLTDLDERPRANELFKPSSAPAPQQAQNAHHPMPSAAGGVVQLSCPIERNNAQPGYSSFHVVQVLGFE